MKEGRAGEQQKQVLEDIDELLDLLLLEVCLSSRHFAFMNNKFPSGLSQLELCFLVLATKVVMSEIIHNMKNLKVGLTDWGEQTVNA